MDNTAKKTVETKEVQSTPQGVTMSTVVGHVKTGLTIAGTIGGAWYLVDKIIDFFSKDGDDEEK